MNEHTKLLIMKAGGIICSTEATGHIDKIDYLHFDAEKFAELIVRECIERVRGQYIPVRDSTVEGRTNPFHPQLKVRTEREEGVIECGVNSVIALEELIQEQTDKWYKENILGDEE
jgi:hypothetical protein